MLTILALSHLCARFQKNKDLFWIRLYISVWLLGYTTETYVTGKKSIACDSCLKKNYLSLFWKSHYRFAPNDNPIGHFHVRIIILHIILAIWSFHMLFNKDKVILYNMKATFQKCFCCLAVLLWDLIYSKHKSYWYFSYILSVLLVEES